MGQAAPTGSSRRGQIAQNQDFGPGVVSAHQPAGWLAICHPLACIAAVCLASIEYTLWHCLHWITSECVCLYIVRCAVALVTRNRDPGPGVVSARDRLVACIPDSRWRA